ncbi:MAG: hypothetical protein K8R86_04790, partial [Bacteroidales bacterium]|nr:hypothetical protein [Bacteroidales bacterium]
MNIDSKYIDEVYEFKGLWDVPSFCGLKIVTSNNNTVIIATELHTSNPGSSVTSWVDKLATELIKKYNLDQKKFIFIEHNPDRKSKLIFYKEIFDKVSFEWDGEKFINPSWKRIT